MLRYKIGAKLQGSHKFIYADNQTTTFEQGTHYAIWYGDVNLPTWVDEAIIYQVFVDRFNPGLERGWWEGEDLRQPLGGTINGATEKLPFIKSMGFNTVWLTPIFNSPSHHGYDISDYYRIHPEFGTLEDFKELLDAAHQSQMKVILDFVANHCSDQHPFFQEALKNPNSQYHDYFVWKPWPYYACFYNVRTMPKFNLAYGQPARAYLLECAQYWLKLGVDGFRLDHAHGPEQDFWVDFRRVCESVKADHWNFAEIVQPADVLASYAGGVGGALDFLLCQALRSTFGQQDWPLSKLAAFLQSHAKYFNAQFPKPAFLDNHDMNRFLVIAKNNDRLLRLALLILFTLPGPPIVYYGTEVPLSQKKSIHAPGAQGFDEARLPMPWELADKFNLSTYISKLARMRQQNPILCQETWRVQHCDDHEELLVLSHGDTSGPFLLINRSEQEKVFSLPAKPGQKFIDWVDHQIYQRENNMLILSLQPNSGTLIGILDDLKEKRL